MPHRPVLPHFPVSRKSNPETEAAELPVPARSAVVVGGGISGLIAARDLARGGLAVTLLEAGAAVGGCVGTHSVAGLTLDSGAESFATRSPAVPELIGELGLGDAVVSPNRDGAWLQLAGEDVAAAAQRMPQSGLLGIPADPRAPEIVRAIGRAGAARAALDKILPVGALARRESVSLGEVVRARMGDAVLRRLVAPVVGGVYSSDPDVLDVDSVAPGLRAALAKHGSLAAAVGSLRASAPAGSAVAGLAGGMGRLSRALEEDLAARGVKVDTGVAVDSVARDGAGWTVSAAGRTLSADALVVATDGPAAVDLLAGTVPELAAARPGPGPGVALVTLVIDQPDLDAHPRGTGVLVAEDVQGVDAKALTHATAKWQWLADSTGPGTHVLRLSYGRALSAADAASARPSPVERDDDDLFAQALADASVLLQVPLGVDDVVGWDVVRWVGALPSAAVGHRDRVASVRAAVDAVPGLEVVGAWLAGTGLAAVTADTRTRMSGLVEQLDQL
ncbi:protoporphyrinogen oxidase [Arthrobacter sp. zg-Y820]|uniref:protoporphyrinogen oxidase n=1 Tax=unclassified Arthrobacter TaxID=235627 RepID=UPI001E441AA7|nr:MULTISPECIES: protoporphyrinogen oxidase [unclassified Arthrobacter]MCC9195933.1 protoporphyrinogen oxidase [Arthrobacter sp. zg-Y820]MDK1278792.1 protoporphyrinogen oxidase [Arthrobacter sp. zg.Y820]MDK1359592.1 protoporphyrinogen oxidase [Arthrobacter sp. zg-Y1219]WIB08788.1 protoporphyrinogen oxidase [Arthrobacter sp. zg-Y820]